MTESSETIYGMLDSLPGAWYPRPGTVPGQWQDELSLLLHSHIGKQNHPGEDSALPSPAHLPYNAGPCHFLLYYAPPPNVPFIIFGQRAVLFASFTGKRHDGLMISSPFPVEGTAYLADIRTLLSHPTMHDLLADAEIGGFLLRDADEGTVRELRTGAAKELGADVFRLRSLREIRYSVYDVGRALDMSGGAYGNLRWHINRFRSSGHHVESRSLGDVSEPVVHLIGQWRTMAIHERKFSYADVRSDRFGARHMGGIPEVLSRVLVVDRKAAAVNMGYPLGFSDAPSVFAHAVGICDLTIPHLSEYAQIDFWKRVKDAGYDFINDGPSWRRGLEVYKKKYRPVLTKRYYWARLDILP